MTDGTENTVADERADRIAARLHEAGVMKLDLYRLLGIRTSAPQQDIEQRVRAARDLAGRGRMADRANRVLPVIERVLGVPAVREVYDRERRLMGRARAEATRRRHEASTDGPPDAGPGPAGTLERAAAQRAMLRGDIGRALDLAEDAMELDPCAASAVTLAGALRLAGELDDAERVARRAVDLSGSTPEATLCLARVVADQGRREDALALVEQTLCDAPRAPGAMALASRLRKQAMSTTSGDPGRVT